MADDRKLHILQDKYAKTSEKRMNIMQEISDMQRKMHANIQDLQRNMETEVRRIERDHESKIRRHESEIKALDRELPNIQRQIQIQQTEILKDRARSAHDHNKAANGNVQGSQRLLRK